MADFSFDLHSRVAPGQNRFIYNPGAFFRVPEAGTYSFSVFVEPVAATYPGDRWTSYPSNCSADMHIDGNKVLSGTTNLMNPGPLDKDLFRGQSFFGQVALEQRDYSVEVKVDCWVGNNLRATSLDAQLPIWKRNRFKILVKGPGDANLRAFGAQELFYLGKPN